MCVTVQMTMIIMSGGPQSLGALLWPNWTPLSTIDESRYVSVPTITYVLILRINLLMLARYQGDRPAQLSV